MKIGLLSDTNYPNLALMKLSAYHKAHGDTVKLVDLMLEQFDLLYISKVFNLKNNNQLNDMFDDKYFYCADQIIRGGSGYAINIKNGKECFNKNKHNKLSADIDCLYPDYCLYGITDTAYGFLTRGCPNKCGFCVTHIKDGCISKQVANLNNFWTNQKEIVLLDQNILACKNRLELLEQLLKSNAYVDFNGGIDARLIDDTTAKILSKIKTRRIHFAFDLIKNEESILKGLSIYRKYVDAANDCNQCVYVLVNYNTSPEEDLYRIRKIEELGYQPYIMVYQKNSRKADFCMDLQRWCNNRILYKSMKFEDYIPRTDGKKIKELYSEYFK